jgi:hypothetical protein
MSDVAAQQAKIKARKPNEPEITPFDVTTTFLRSRVTQSNVIFH